MEEKLELRMYSIVMYNLSPIQKGIQAYHATIEATNNFGNKNSIDEKLFKDWAKNWKTVILLDGGSSSDIGNIFDILWEMGIGISYFREPDLNNSMSAVSFIVDERVFNTEKYPDYDEWLIKQYQTNNEVSSYKDWINIIGEKNLKLRTFLKTFKLSR